MHKSVVGREILPRRSLGPGLLGSVRVLTLRGMGADGHDGVGPMTLLGSGESGIEERDRLTEAVDSSLEAVSSSSRHRNQGYLMGYRQKAR